MVIDLNTIKENVGDLVNGLKVKEDAIFFKAFWQRENFPIMEILAFFYLNFLP